MKTEKPATGQTRIKRGLALTKYGTLAATTRQRFVQALPYLNAAGIEVELAPLFDNDYLSQMFAQGKRPLRSILRAYWQRLLLLRRCGDYDFIWVQYELFPYLPGVLEQLIGWAGKPVVYDIDDAIFHQYDSHRNPLVRLLLGHKLKPLLRRCALAFCGNEYLQTYVARFCPHTEIIPTVVDTDVYVVRAKSAAPKPVVGWIGSPSTWSYCLPLAGLFSDLVRADKMSMLVVGAGHAASDALPFAFLDWAEEREVADIQRMDIGIMPLPDAPWARGKCGYKLIQYMACGLPVIASPVGVNSEIVQHGVNGFLATTEAEWRDAIAQLLGDAALRQRMGKAGRAAVEQRYAIQQYGPRIAELLQQI